MNKINSSDSEQNSSIATASRRSWMKSAALLASSAATANALESPESAGSELSEPKDTAHDRVIASDSKNVVETNSGKVRGFTRNGVHIFRGIPYGAPTGGKNRFMPPQKPESWTGIRSALYYEQVSPFPPRSGWHEDENAFMFQWNDGQPGEDCLRINVWTPGINDNRKRPVMVWLHGRGFASGSGQELLSYDGENLCHRGDVVVLTLNHRLNTFGFLDLSELGGEQFARSGNVGMLDLVLALEWVRDRLGSRGGWNRHSAADFRSRGAIGIGRRAVASRDGPQRVYERNQSSRCFLDDRPTTVRALREYVR